MKEYIDETALEYAKAKIIGNAHNTNGIGTLSEKTMHGVLKYYYEPDIDYQEVALNGYVADIFRDEKVIEIQTGNFGRMRNKLSVFLDLYKVKIVYPIPCNKWLNLIDTDTGELLSRRKSPKKGTSYDAFFELYKIKDFLSHKNLTIELLLVNTDEYRIKNTGKNPGRRSRKPSVKYDRIPLSIEDIITLEEPNDYMMFLPNNLPEEFTVKEFAGAAGIDEGTVSTVLNILMSLGVVVRTSKRGRAYLYKASYT